MFLASLGWSLPLDTNPKTDSYGLECLGFTDPGPFLNYPGPTSLVLYAALLLRTRKRSTASQRSARLSISTHALFKKKGSFRFEHPFC